MSDQKDDDQKDFETMFSSKDRENDVIDNIVDDFSSPSSKFSDIDDGIDAADDEEGIFAAPSSSSSKKPAKKSSFGLMLFTASALAIVGAGGYLYSTNPDLINQIKANFTGESAAPEQVQPALQMGDVALTQEGASVTPDATVSPNDMGDMPPQPEPASASVSDPALTPPPAPEMVSPDMPVSDAPVGDVAAAQPAEIPQDVPPVIPPSEGAPSESFEAMGEVAPPPASIEPPPADVTGAVAPSPLGEDVPAAMPSDQPIAPAEVVPEPAPELSKADAPLEGTPPAEEMKKVENSQIFTPTEKKTAHVDLVDDVAGESPSQADLADAPKDKPSGDSAQKDAPAVAEAPTYFDSPPGDILKALPAPSMSAQRGKTESIIIVDSPKKKSSKSKALPPKVYEPESVKIETTSLDSRIVAASRALKLGRYEAATAMYEELYQLNPRDSRILMGRAVCFQKVGDLDRAASTYEEVLTVDPKNAEAIVNLTGLIRKEHPAVALEKLLSLRSHYPENPTVAAQLGVAYADSGNLPDAFRYLSMASSMEPNNPQHYFNMAIVAERGQDVRRAIGYYEKALEVDAIHGSGRAIPRDQIYDRLTRLRGN